MARPIPLLLAVARFSCARIQALAEGVHPCRFCGRPQGPKALREGGPMTP